MCFYKMDVTSKAELISGYCFNEAYGKGRRRIEDFYFEERNLVPCIHSVIKNRPCDVIIEVEGQLFEAHRSILSKLIPYFQNMFNHNWRESNNRVITMPNMSADIMKHICRFVYTGKFLVSHSHLEELWYTADYLSWNNLLASMSRHLSLNLDPENVFQCIKMSEYVNDSLYENAMNFLRQYFVYLMNEDAFLDLEFRQVTEVLGHDCLNVLSEKSVLIAMVKWLRHDFKNRRQCLKELINGNCIRKRFLSNKDLNILMDDPVLGNTSEVRTFLEEFRRNRTLARKNKYPAIPRMPFNPALSIGEVILMSNVHHEESCVLKYFPQTGKWQRFSSVVGYSYFSAIVHKDKLFLVGGDVDASDERSTRLSCLDLDDPNASFYNRTSMYTARSSPGLVAHNDFIYVIGGEGDPEEPPTIERYSVSQNKWKKISQAKSFVRCFFACCIHKDCIYIIGGCDIFTKEEYVCGILQHAMVEIYNISKKRWSFAAANLQEARYDCSVAVLDGYIYVVGGKSDIHPMEERQALRSVERFSLDEQRFEYVASLNYARSQCVLVASLGRLWAFGGIDGDNTRPPIEVYNPAEDCWTVVGRMPTQLYLGVSGGYRMYQ